MAFCTLSPSRVIAATTSVSEDATTITVNVANKYRAIFTKGDTTDYLKIYDRAEDDVAPDLLLEEVGPYIDEGGIAYQLRYDLGRTMQVVEASDTRVVVEVKGNFCRTGLETCLDDGADDLSVIVVYTFTPFGMWVKNVTNFQTSGVALDTTDANDGYNWINVEVDGTDAAFSDAATPAIYYGDGTTESSTTTDGVAFEDTNVYVTLPGQGSYQSMQVGVTKWLSEAGGTDDWYWDENYSGTLDVITARERGTTPTGAKTMSWFVRLATQGQLDTESEREAIINDQRNPDTLTFTTGSAWNEDGTDTFNEAQGTNTTTFSSNQLHVDIDGDTYTRFYPSWKFKSWRSLSLPESLSLDALWLAPFTNYNLSLQPISSAYWSTIALYTSLESSAVANTPNIGPAAGATNGTTTYVAARYGNGTLFDQDGESITYSGVNFTGNSFFDAESDFGTMAVEFWYKPTSEDSIATSMGLFNFRYDASNQINLQKSSSGLLSFAVSTNGTNYSYTVDNANYNRLWEIGKWVHFRVEWDDNQGNTTQQKIFINGIEPTHSDPGTEFSITNLTNAPISLVIGNVTSGGASEARGVIDEFYVYSGTPQPLAAGGNTADTDEYLHDSSNDFTLSFTDDSTTNQAEYLFLGGETKFSGVNSSLATLGSGSSPSVAWEYWDGSAWNALSVTDTTSGASDFTASGNFYFTPPVDWTSYARSNSPELYYVRAHLESGSFSTNPIEDTIRTDVIIAQYLNTITSAAQSLSIPLENPSISFTVNAVPASTLTNGITTSVASTTTTLPFGSLLISTPKYVAHELSATTNAHFGYAVTMKLVNYLQGNYPGNNIDPFPANWSMPTTWTEPTGTTTNIDTGWIGANTSDTRVANWSSASGLFGGITSSAQTVMYSTSADSGSDVYVTYALEVNDRQPADLYSGTITYTITPTY